MEKNISRFQPEIWAGNECTINRVNDCFHDQLAFAEHYDREEDLDLIASLGIKTLRFPILWEKHQPVPDQEICWDVTAKQLNKLRQLGITPIAGLLHHGSGPSFTNLLDPEFPFLFAEYAKKVQLQFPQLKYFTPVNEPLTTARFSGLYGHWYPHHRDALSFAKMLINQLKATVLAMKKIREINPRAQLVQTEDLGKIYSRKKLQYQADFENERRWLTFDLLCGKVNAKHPMWKYLVWLGIPGKDLEFFLENVCKPDIIGVNHYLTSERFLDDHYRKYPTGMAGGNGKHKYVDVDAIRIQHKQKYGLEQLLRETWERYGSEIAVTEIHLNCYREHQLRWFKHAHDIATKLIREGIKIKAITAWSLLGAFGWNKLVTVAKGDYESGVFDLQPGKLRPTALYSFIRSLNGLEEKKFHVIDEPGWWQMDSRFIHPKKNQTASLLFSASDRTAPLLIVGKRGTLGSAFARICESRGISYRLLSRDELEMTNSQQVEAAIDHYKPWAIINAAGYVRVDDAEFEKEKCYNDNFHGPEQLAMSCHQHGIKLVSFSSDLVFNGEKKHPYLEQDTTSPLNVYGDSKAKAEHAILSHCNDALIIRTSAFFGPWDQYNFVHHVIKLLGENRTIDVAVDLTVSPTYVPDLVNRTLDLLIDDEKHICHLSNLGSVTWADLAKEIARRVRGDINLLNPKPAIEMSFKAIRPAYTVLNTGKGFQLPDLDHALERYFAERTAV